MRTDGTTRPLIGRVAERAAIAACLDTALAGRRQVVLVAGEPGAGKSRLAEDALEQARALGLAGAVGRASEDEGSPPYWPILQVFRGLGAAPPAELTGTGDASARERFQLFEATADALVAAAESSGLLVVLDDLQWADAATVRLLVHLASSATPARLVLLATYRDTETTGQDALRAAVAALAREATVTRIRLTGLTQDEVAQQLAALTGWAVPESVAAAICQRTRGNPFFVGELGRRLASSADGDLPEGVRDAVRDRLGRLSPACRGLVAAAAVLGSNVDPITLAHATGADIDGVLAALDEASAAGILTNGFAHDLIREAARLDVPTARRLALHRGMAEHLSARGDADTRAGEIAYHWLESLPAGDAAQAVGWAERAADRAMSQLAWEEAASLYRRALDAGAVALTPADRCRLLLSLAEAQVRIFDIDDATQNLTVAADLARAAGDAGSLARAALAMEGVNNHEWDAVGRALCEEVLAVFPTVDSPVRARLLAQLSVTYGWSDAEELKLRSSEALAMAERVGDRRALREALRARQMALSGPEGAADRLALGDRLLALGGDDDGDAALWGRLWRFDALCQLGHIDAAEGEVRLIAMVAARLRSPLATWHAERCQSAMAAARGRFAQAMEHARAAEAVATRAGTPAGRGLMGLLLDQIGDETIPYEPYDSPVVASFLRSIQAKNLLAQGNRDEAYRVYRTLSWSEGLPPFVHLSAYDAMAGLSAEFDDRETAAELYRRMLPWSDLFVCSGAGVIMVLGTVRFPLGIAAATMGRLDDAVRHLRAAVESGERTGMPPMVAQARYELAKVLARRVRPGDRDEASALATAAAAQAGELGMRPLQRRARELMNSLTGQGSGPLTRREREVAALVAQGLSNRQIAAASHISERTVESHVQHILDKLGFANRTQIATWVAEGRS